MLNKVFVMGRLTKDPELRYTGSNVPVVSFSIACERDVKNQDGEKETDFINCSAWRGTAEFVSKYFAKGKPIIAVGRLQTRRYEAKDGSPRTAVEVVAETVYFAESRSSDAAEADDTGRAPVKWTNLEAEDDLPF